MLSIQDGEVLSRALSSPIDEQIKRLLQLRRDQLGGDITNQAHFAIVQPADSAADLEKSLGFPLLSVPEFSPEWVQDHGFAYEAVWILTDDDYAHVVLIPKEQGISPELLNFCAQYASEHA